MILIIMIIDGILKPLILFTDLTCYIKKKVKNKNAHHDLSHYPDLPDSGCLQPSNKPKCIERNSQHEIKKKGQFRGYLVT